MIEAKSTDVNTKSSEFKEGVEAGLNSPEDTKNWIAGNDLGQALKDEPGDKKPATEINIASAPLFMRSSPERARGNAQDEKDATEE
ncbi:MAG TPA: hypothetical protein VIT88_10375 [Pyrinomonadaceae bacterium]